MDAAARPVEVVCVGDSITQRGQPSWQYPTYVQQKLGPGFRVTNCGHNGALLTDNASRSSDYYLSTPELKKCKTDSPSPDVVTIMLGTNDSGYWDTAKSTYQAEYAKLVGEFEKLNPRVKIVAATSPSAAAMWGGGLIKGAVIRDQIAPLVRTITQDNGYVLADVNAATASWFTQPDLAVWDMTNFADAGVHPNDAGAKIIADQFVTAIERALASLGATDAGNADAASSADAAIDGDLVAEPEDGAVSRVEDAATATTLPDAAPVVRGPVHEGGALAAADAALAMAAPADGAGCSCRTSSRSSRGTPLGLLGLALAFAFAFRRKRSAAL